MSAVSLRSTVTRCSSAARGYLQPRRYSHAMDLTKPLEPEFEQRIIRYQRNIHWTAYLLVLAPLPIVWFYYPEVGKRALAIRQTRSNNANATLQFQAEPQTQTQRQEEESASKAAEESAKRPTLSHKAPAYSERNDD